MRFCFASNLILSLGILSLKKLYKFCLLASIKLLFFCFDLSYKFIDILVVKLVDVRFVLYIGLFVNFMLITLLFELLDLAFMLLL